MYTLKVYKLHIEQISILYKDVAFKDTSYVVWNNLISKIELSTSEEYDCMIGMNQGHVVLMYSSFSRKAWNAH